jgi:YidC/Oxa1 family membrane protein insertase
MMDFFDAILHPLEVLVAWIMVGFHQAFTAVGFSSTSGWTWALSIVGLVVVIRIILIPLFVKQIKASRGLQLIQPQLKAIQDKYKGKTDQASRQAMTQETMALYRETGTNPFSSCLPILLQSPVFFALFRVLNGIQSVANGSKEAIGPLDQTLASEANQATLFGAPLSDTFMHAETLSTQLLTVVLIILMSASTFTTQRQLMMKNMPANALDNPFAKQQKVMLYVLPLIFAVSGVNFPIGVLIYWLTTNVWSMGQQFYVIRRMPAPGSPAEEAMNKRREKHHGSGATNVSGTDGEDGEGNTASDSTDSGTGQRQQPKRQSRSKRGTGGSGAGTRKGTGGGSSPSGKKR